MKKSLFRFATALTIAVACFPHLASAQITSTVTTATKPPVVPPTVKAMTLPMPSVYVGQLLSSAGTLGPGASVMLSVVLNAPAPAGGVKVAIVSSDTNALSAPAVVTVAAGTTTQTFMATTGHVGANTSVNVTASTGFVTRSTNMTVTPTAALAEVRLGGISSATGGLGTVLLTAPAPAGGATVSLSSSSIAAATVPASVLVPAGWSSNTFMILPHAVPQAQSVTFSASWGGVTKTAAATIAATANAGSSTTPAQLDHVGVIGKVSGATKGVASAVFTTSVSSAKTVTFSSNSPVVTFAHPTTTISYGETALAEFDTTSVAADTPVTISATSGGKTVQTTVTIPPARVKSITFDHPDTMVYTSVTGTVTLVGPAPAGGRVIKLTSTEASSQGISMTLPSQVTVPQGQTQVSFSFQYGGLPPNVPTDHPITVSWVDDPSVQSTLTVHVRIHMVPPSYTCITGYNPQTTPGAFYTQQALWSASGCVKLSEFSLSQSGQSTTATIWITTPAFAGGMTIPIGCSQDPDRSGGTAGPPVCPATVTIPEGATSATFTVKAPTMSQGQWGYGQVRVANPSNPITTSSFDYRQQ